MTTLLRTLARTMLACIVVVMICGVVASLAHLGYMRPEWSDVAFWWGVLAATAGILTFFAALAVAEQEQDND